MNTLKKERNLLIIANIYANHNIYGLTGLKFDKHAIYEKGGSHGTALIYRQERLMISYEDFEGWDLTEISIYHNNNLLYRGAPLTRVR